MDGVNNAFCSNEIARLTTKCAGLQLKIDDQAAEIGVLKIAHEAHQTNNLKMLAVLKKQNAEIASLRNDLTTLQDIHAQTVVDGVAGFDAVALELAKTRSICDQLRDALEEAMYSNATKRAIDKSVTANKT